MTSSLAKKPSAAGEAEIVRHLNATLRYALTAINQRFLHARMLKYQRVMKLADQEYKESLEIMRHADRLVERILNLGGMPNLKDLASMDIGATPEEMLRCTLKLEEQAAAEIEAGIRLCEAAKDEASGALLAGIRKSIQEHTTFLRQQLDAIASMGATAYLLTQV